MNSGYVGYSRSVRSQEAIESFEVPISHINRNLISSYLEDMEEEYTTEEVAVLQATKVCFWKYTAGHIVEPSSWHHTSNYFNQTDHYSLYRIARAILKDTDGIKQQYEAHRVSEKAQKNTINYQFGVITVQVWGGTRKNPKIVDHHQVSGIILGDWLYFERGGCIEKYKTIANKVEQLDTFHTYKDLVKRFPQYKSTKPYFTKLIAQKVK